MEELTNEKLMLLRIYNFVSQYHDYQQIPDFKTHKTIGCYNAFYHLNEGGFSMVYKPSKTKKLPIVISSYIALDNKEVYVITVNSNKYKLKNCGYASIKSVYKTLIKEKEE